MKSLRLRLWAPILLVLMACGLAGNPGFTIDLPILGDPGTPEIPTVILPQNGQATATPFLPLDPTARALTPTPLPTAPWGGFPGPSVPPEFTIPPPAAAIAQPEGQVNVLLLGSDQRPFEGGFRTDAIVLLTLDPEGGAASLTSFPRDLYVYIPGWTMQRINTALPHGGFEMLQDTFEYNFGVRPDYYALINFWGFVEVVDSLGGIQVNVAVSLTDHRDGYGSYTVPAGYVTMDGETALWYVRSRYSTSDFDRTRRQQEVLVALFFRMVSLDGISRASELYNLYISRVETNVGLGDVTPHLGLAAELAGDTGNLHTYAVGSTHVTPYTTSAGAAVLLPDYEAIEQILNQALHAP